jgi:hypothetical protein
MAASRPGNRAQQGSEHQDNDATDEQARASQDHRTSTLGTRCSPGNKRVGPTCVGRLTPVAIQLRQSVSDDLSRAAWYVKNHPRLVREAVEAGEEAIEAFKRAEAQR